MDHVSPTAHRRAWDAIPWVVAGAASDEDLQSVHSHLPHCEECRAEWDLQQRVKAGLDAALPTALPDPTPAWQRLQARLDDTGATPRGSDLGRAAPPGWTRWLAAAVLVQAVGLGAAGVAWLEHRHDAAQGPAYRTLSQAPSASPTVTLRLVPAPDMDFASLQQLLSSLGLVVVEIASDGHSLGLAPADGAPRHPGAALPVLRARADVLLAEPVVP